MDAARRMLHDVGKIGIPDAVLKKPGKFDASDWDVMKAHAAKSQRIVLASDIDGADDRARRASPHASATATTRRVH